MGDGRGRGVRDGRGGGVGGRGAQEAGSGADQEGTEDDCELEVGGFGVVRWISKKLLRLHPSNVLCAEMLDASTVYFVQTK